jgi:hypothetical protein
MVDGTIASDSKYPEPLAVKQPSARFQLKSNDAAVNANKEFVEATAALLPPKSRTKRKAAAARRKRVADKARKAKK